MNRRPGPAALSPAARRRGFSLVELLVVVGIIAVLIGLLMPALQKARRQANTVVCLSNMRDAGAHLLVYANNWRGAMFPPKLGADKPRDRRWPVHVFQPAVWNPPALLCPTDFEPVEEHSYILNHNLADHGVRYHRTNVNGLSPTQVIVMGEKVTASDHYYMNANMGDYHRIVEFYRHGPLLGSNYLFMDLHAETAAEIEARFGIDEWAVSDAEPAENPEPES